MGLVEHNPVVGTIQPKKNGRDDEKRVLSDAEIAAVWQSCRDDDFGKIASAC